MRNYIKDLTKVAEYFVYIEKSDNIMLYKQLKKDRRKAINSFIGEIEKLQRNGDWIKGYIGNKIVENLSSHEDSTEDGGEKITTPIKEFDVGTFGELRELISTERFLYDDDIKRNPYLFESDEYVRQKYLERKYQAYSEVKINNDEFVKITIEGGSTKKDGANAVGVRK